MILDASFCSSRLYAAFTCFSDGHISWVRKSFMKHRCQKKNMQLIVFKLLLRGHWHGVSQWDKHFSDNSDSKWTHSRSQGRFVGTVGECPEALVPHRWLLADSASRIGTEQSRKVKIKSLESVATINFSHLAQLLLLLRLFASASATFIWNILN